MKSNGVNGRASTVRHMFARIAKRYDLVNRLMTFGRDQSWRRQTITKLKLPSKARVADLGSGTGDLAFEISQQNEEVMVIASDFTREMIEVGKKRQGTRQVHWLLADANWLPIASESLDAVISGFLLRNVDDVHAALSEQKRVLKAGGYLAALETTSSRPGPFHPFVEFYLNRVVPLLGKLVARDFVAYQYLSSSTWSFLSAEKLASNLNRLGFQGVGFERRMLGTIAIHWGKKTNELRS